MAKVLKFPVVRTKSGPRNRRPSNCEVVIFPGVRIERGDFCLSDRLPALRQAKSAARARAMRRDD